jgi:hypothetical protein
LARWRPVGYVDYVMGASPLPVYFLFTIFYLEMCSDPEKNIY